MKIFWELYLFIFRYKNKKKKIFLVLRDLKLDEIEKVSTFDPSLLYGWKSFHILSFIAAVPQNSIQLPKLWYALY